MGGTPYTIQRKQMDYKSDRVDTTRMDKTAGKTKNMMDRQPHLKPGSCAAKNSKRPASVETVQGGVPPYGVKDTLVVDCKQTIRVRTHLSVGTEVCSRDLKRH